MSEEKNTLKEESTLLVRKAKELEKNGDVQQAESSLQQAISMYKNQNDATHYAVLVNQLAMFYLRQKKFQQCLQKLQEAIATPNLSDAETIGLIEANIGTLLAYQLEKRSESIPHFEKSIQVTPDLYSRCRRMMTLADVYDDLKQLDKALPLCKKAYDLISSNLKDNDDTIKKQLIEHTAQLARFYFQLRDFKNAEIYFKKRVDLLEKKDTPEGITAQLELIESMKGLLKDKAACEYYEKLLPTIEKIYGKDHLQVANCCNNIAQLKWQLFKPNEAVEFFTKALKIFEVRIGEEHPLCQLIRRNIQQNKMEASIMNKNKM